MDTARFLQGVVPSSFAEDASKRREARLFGIEVPGVTDLSSAWGQRYGVGLQTMEKPDLEPMTRRQVKEARLRDHKMQPQDPLSKPKPPVKKGVFRL